MKPNEQETNVKTGEWKSPEVRKRVVNILMDALIKKGGSSWAQGIPELLHQVENFEENVNTSSKNQGEYFAIVSSKLKKICSLPDVAVPKPMPLNSSGSEARKDAYAEWQEQVYQRVQRMKSTYFPKLYEHYQIVNRKFQQVVIVLQSSPHEIKTKHLERYKHYEKIFGAIVSLLEVSKSQITSDFERKLDQAENQLLRIVGTNNVPSPSNTSQIQISETKSSSQVLRTKQVSQQNNLQAHEVTKQPCNVQKNLNHQSITEGPANTVQRQLSGAQATEACGVSVNTMKNEISHKPTLIFYELSPAMQRLVKALDSMSPEALSTTVSDIRNVLYLDDARPTLKSVDRPPDRKMSCSINAVAFDTSRICANRSDSFNWFTDAKKPDFNSVTSEVKGPRIKENYALLEEIKEINNRLIDSEVVIGEKDVTRSGEGLVVKFLFNAITVNLNEISLAGDKKSLIEPIRLLVPTSYPSSSPVVLDNMPMEFSEGLDDLSAKAKSKLRVSLLSKDQSLSLRDLAMSWDHCAREAILEYAEANGGGSFTSKYGGWETWHDYD